MECLMRGAMLPSCSAVRPRVLIRQHGALASWQHGLLRWRHHTRRGGERRGSMHVCHAKGKSTGSRALDEALDMGRGVVDSLAGFVPESVPRPVAKGGVTLAAGLVAFWVVQKVLSTVFTLALLGGAAYLYLRSYDGSGASSRAGDSTNASSSAQDVDDPLSEARRIMDKYK